MKKLLFAVLPVTLLFLLSCQKELNPDGFNGGGAPDQLLIKLAIKNGADSNVTEFGYNNNKKLVSVRSLGVDAGTDIDTRETFVRNSQGIITQIITKDADLVASGVDSVISKVNYSGGRYTSRVSIIDFFGFFQFKDSAVFTYNGSGNIIVVEDFLDVGTGYERFLKTEYTYTGKNITTEKYFSYDDASSSYVEEAIKTVTYDAKKSPLNLGLEAFAMGYYNWYSANNAVKSVTVSSADPTQSETQDVTYVYNSSDKPVSGTTVIQGGPTATFTFTYK